MKPLNGGVSPETLYFYKGCQCDSVRSFPIKKKPMFFLTLCLTISFSGPLDLFFNDFKTPKINFLHYFCLYVNKYNYVMKIYQ